MMGAFIDFARAMYEYWNGFGIPAYPEEMVPDDAVLPYITYDLKRPYWQFATTYAVRVWYHDTSMVAITEKVDEIASDIGNGKRLTEGGVIIYLYKEDTFFQMQPIPDEETDYKVAYLSMNIQVLAN